MTHDDKIEHALIYLYNQGYGKGSNYTTMTIASLMVEYAEHIVLCSNLNMSRLPVKETEILNNTFKRMISKNPTKLVKDKLGVALQQPPVISTFSKCECGGELIQISINTNQCNKCFREFHNI